MAKSAEEQKIETIIARQNKLLEEQLAKEKQLATLQKERTGFMEREVDAASKRSEEAKARLDMASEALQISEEERKARLAIIDAKLRQAKIDAVEGNISKEKLSDIQKYHDQLAPILSASKKQLEILHKQADAEEKKLDTIRKQKEAAKGLAEAMKDAVGSATGISDAWESGTDVGSRLAQAAVYGTDLKDVLKGITSGLTQSLNPANLLGSVITNMVSSTTDLFLEMDQSLADFRKETGLSQSEFRDSITSTRQEMVHLNIATEDVIEQFDNLASANTAFVFQNAAVRDSLQSTAVAFEAAYNAGGQFSEAVGFATTALGQAPDEAKRTTMGLAKFAKDIKASPKEMMADYASLGPRLAAWGKNATKVFKETAAAAKALNIESAALLDIAGQFDTFDEAAEHVGQLNAMLGGDYFDTVEMVNASESERIEMLMEGVRATGKSWDSLGRFERKAIATAAGISDMAEANKMFGQGLDVYKELQEQVNNTAMSYNDLSDAARENMGIQEKQAAIQKSLAVSLEPFMDIANSVLGVIQSIASATGALFPVLATATAWFLKIAWAQSGAAIATKLNTLATGLYTAALNSNLVVSAWMYATLVKEAVVSKGLALAKGGLALAQGAYTTAMNSSLVVSAWMYATIIAETVATKAAALAKGALALAQGALTTAMNSNLVVSAWMYASLLAENVVTWAAAAAKGALSLALGVYNVVAGIATAVTSALAAAVTFLLSPIGLVILAIAATIAIVSGLIYYWDELTAYTKDLTGGFFDMWDVVSLMLGPIGLFITAGRKIYEHWEPLKQLFLDIVYAISDAASAVGDFLSGGWDTFTGFFGFGGDVASNADGSTNFSGTSLVGERGPEIITTQGANIITNENITRLIETNESVVQAASGVKKAEMNTDVSIFDMIASNFGFQPAAAAAGPQGVAPVTQTPIEVVLQIDGEKIGRTVIEPWVEKNIKPKLEV